MQYTIEARELTSESTHRAAYDGRPQRTLIEAGDVDEAIDQYVRASDAQLVSLSRPARGGESIATVKKEDAVFLVRVYAA